MKVLTVQFTTEEIVDALKRRSGPHGRSSFQVSEDGTKIKKKGLVVLKPKIAQVEKVETKQVNDSDL